jgi:dTDP-4-dehydrorhamnose reductase
MKPTILLTGKTGQLGSELHRLLSKLGEVLAPHHKDLDLLDPAQIRRVMQQAKPQWIVNAAGYTAVDAAESDQANALAINAEGPRLLALEAKKTGAALVHFSTDYVFDGLKKVPYLETDPTNPINAYGRSKFAGEQAIRDSGVIHLIFRTSWLYATHGRNFLLTVLRLATERQELKIVDDQIGAPTCAADLAAATTTILAVLMAGAKGQLISPDLAGSYHMSAAGQTTWYEFAKAILDEAARAPRNLSWLASATNGRPLLAARVLPISTEEFRSPTRRPAYSVLSNARLKEAFGVTLPAWRIQLQGCFSSERFPAKPPAAISSR